MQVSFNSPSYQTKNPSFGYLTPKHFFITGCGKNLEWGKSMVAITETAANKIKNKESFDNLLAYIAKSVKELHPEYENFGVLRFCKAGFKSDGIHGRYKPLVLNDGPRLKEYKARYKALVISSDNNRFSVQKPYPYMSTAYITKGWVRIPKSKHAQLAWQHTQRVFNSITDKYLTKITPGDLPKINEEIAGIQWLFSQTMPFMRGTDSITNILTKSIYEALGIQTHPPKKKFSFDLQAFCTELSDYKKNYHTYFEKPPEIIQPNTEAFDAQRGLGEKLRSFLRRSFAPLSGRYPQQ